MLTSKMIYSRQVGSRDKCRTLAKLKRWSYLLQWFRASRFHLPYVKYWRGPRSVSEWYFWLCCSIYLLFLLSVRKNF